VLSTILEAGEHPLGVKVVLDHATVAPLPLQHDMDARLWRKSSPPQVD